MVLVARGMENVKMERYLKFVKMKSMDGSTILPPVCCMSCPKKVCPISCTDYEDAMKNVKCTQFEMEFGIVDLWKEVLHSLWYLALIGLVFFIMFQLFHRDEKECIVSVDRCKFGTASNVGASVSFSGTKIDAESFMQALNKAMQTCAESK